MVSNEAASSGPAIDALQQKYIELLEKRIAQLETAVSKPATEESSDESETQAAEKKDEKDKGENKPDAAKASRYRNILRKWDKASGAHKDTVVGAGWFDKPKAKEFVYTFRRVYNPDTGEQDAYSEIEIEDELLIQLLRAEIGKYPGVTFDGELVYMRSPFPALIHNWNKLEERIKRTPDAQECKDLLNLLDRVRTSPELEGYFKVREAHAASRVVTYETLWTVFAPNTLIVARPFMNTPQILKVADSPIPYHRRDLHRALWMWAWCWDWDGKRMLKVEYRLKFERFPGTKDITELQYYPLCFYDNPEELRSTVRKRSLQFIKTTARCPPGASQMFLYDGLAYADQRNVLSNEDDNPADDDVDERSNKNEDDPSASKLVPIKGEIISDAFAFMQYGKSTNERGKHPLGELRDIYIDELQATEEESIEFQGKIGKLDLSKELDEKDDNFLVLPPRILGYATREKIWGQFRLDSTDAPAGKQPEKFRNDLQLNDKYKNLIEALVTSHTQNQPVEDVVKGKGKGLVLLLHGPPGVGKTLTAETIAAATGKPLFVVSVAEIGLDASRAERNLEKLFDLATKWQAILLVDEADVFLETRGSTSDASRNTLVSVLLRVLEYYEGIIIMTTNRIKAIDVAVISRIHLAIRYEDLDDSQMRSIFKYYLDQLEPEQIDKRGEINEFINSFGHHYGLNGRQIRNVVSAAQACARHEFENPGSFPSVFHSDGRKGDGRLTFKHLRAVCEMTRDFQEQLKEDTMTQRLNNEVMSRRSRM